MSTKVKGGAIKEGSIPLSALSNEVKDKIENSGGGAGGADWNAQEGEAGFIENKPFNEPIHVTIPDTYQHTFHLAKEITAVNILCDGSEDVCKFYPDKSKSLQWECMDAEHFFKFEWDGNGTLQIVETLAEESLRGLIEITQEKGALNTNLIPDTVIKTTPQKLSDNDKNQALANLGIDPVVWRYICNPLRIQDGSYILSELVKEGNFVVKAPNAYRFIDSSGYEYTPVEIGDTVMQVETFDGYVSLSLQYDSDREEYQIVKIL
jgi:hypothetical protein